MKLFDVNASRGGDHAITFSLSGELDLSTVDQLQSGLDACVNGRPELVVLDLRSLEFMDSTGLRLMLRLDQRLRGQNGRLVLVQGPPRVHRVFELTMATEELEIVADPSEIGARSGDSDKSD